ncbi:MAG: response regulator [Terracidiphilus sp.]
MAIWELPRRNDVSFAWTKEKNMPGRILVIDDEPQITRVLRAALSAQGYDVRAANEPEEGLQVFRDWAPDLVITDLMMPTMSGVEVCRAIRSRGRNACAGAFGSRARAVKGRSARCGRRRLRH